MGEKKSRFSFFDKPLNSDWAFWIYGLFVFIYSFGSYSDYYSGTSITSLSSAGLFAAIIDLVVFPLLGALVFPTSLLLITRRIARGRNYGNEKAVFERNRSEGNGLELNESPDFSSKLPKLTRKQTLVAGTAVGLTLALVQVSQQYDLSKLFENSQGKPLASETEALSEPGAVKRAPTEATPTVASPEISPTKAATKSPAPKPTKNPSPSKSATPAPEPAPVASWWPAYYSPWGDTIAYKYSHYTSYCTDPPHPNPSLKCQGSHSASYIVTEPCTSFSVEFTDDSGNVTIGYHEFGWDGTKTGTYLPTGQTFSVGTSDDTPLTPGRVSKIVCTR